MGASANGTFSLGTPFLALSFGGGAVNEVLHALRCGLALSPVSHDLPTKKKKKKLSASRCCSGCPLQKPCRVDKEETDRMCSLIRASQNAIWHLSVLA